MLGIGVVFLPNVVKNNVLAKPYERAFTSLVVSQNVKNVLPVETALTYFPLLCCQKYLVAP
jgi:hypothetical protein